MLKVKLITRVLKKLMAIIFCVKNKILQSSILGFKKNGVQLKIISPKSQKINKKLEEQIVCTFFFLKHFVLIKLFLDIYGFS